jgi:hypothetical protein
MENDVEFRGAPLREYEGQIAHTRRSLKTRVNIIETGGFVLTFVLTLPFSRTAYYVSCAFIDHYVVLRP